MRLSIFAVMSLGTRIGIFAGVSLSGLLSSLDDVGNEVGRITFFAGMKLGKRSGKLMY